MSWLTRLVDRSRALRLARDKRRLEEAAKAAGCSLTMSKRVVAHYFKNRLET